MIFARTTGGTLRITPLALATMQAFVQSDDASPEAGGILLGRIYPDTRDLSVDVATAPHPIDKRRRFSFFRARKPGQVAINTAWAGSSGEQNYLGEWHTHPEPHPTPSQTDVDNWRALARRASFQQEFLVFVIVGTASIRAWEVAKGSREVVAFVATTGVNAAVDQEDTR